MTILEQWDLDMIYDGDDRMKTAIMQPYFLPYIGYFQLINSVDKFVVYDNIQYTKKGWINRNRFLQNGKDAVFSIALKKDSDFLNVRDRIISADFDRTRVLNQVKAAYRNAPYFENAFHLFEKAVLNNEENLFDFIYYSIIEICKYVGIDTTIVKSSDIGIDHSLKSQDKVIAICESLGTNIYINSIGGQELYDNQEFQEHGIELKFIKSNPITYDQFDNEFVPWLSIIDVMMFNSVEEIRAMLLKYELI